MNSLIFLADKNSRGGPLPEDDKWIWTTPSCIAVCCMSEMDGETEVVLGDLDDVMQDSLPAFEGTLMTPHRTVVVSTVDDTPLVAMAVKDTVTAVRIWTNDVRMPDKVIIGVGAP